MAGPSISIFKFNKRVKDRDVEKQVTLCAMAHI
jgi:hypothetical protein